MDIEHEKWVTIFVNGSICSPFNLSEEDREQIEKVKRSYVVSCNLDGYCPLERALVMKSCELESRKYRLETVFEQYGVGWYELQKLVFSSSVKEERANGQQ